VQDCVLFCLYFDLSFSYSVVLLRFEARAALTYRIHFCVPSSIFVLRPLRLSWFKLSLVMVLHAVACCPVSCANNCSFVGLHWELHQGIHLFLLFFFFFFFFPDQSQTKNHSPSPKHNTNPSSHGSHPSLPQIFVLQPQLIGWWWRGESIMLWRHCVPKSQSVGIPGLVIQITMETLMLRSHV